MPQTALQVRLLGQSHQLVAGPYWHIAHNHSPPHPSLDAVPFEEDDKDSSIWFLDHSYLENMFRMFKKVNGTYLVCSRIIE